MIRVVHRASSVETPNFNEKCSTLRKRPGIVKERSYKGKPPDVWATCPYVIL